MQLIAGAGVYTPTASDKVHWVEHMRSADLSVGTYSIPAGGTDAQDPHTEDEVYVITAGTARLRADSGEVAVAAGSVIFVPANERHHFVDVTSDFAALVIFAPAEYSRRA
jgi:mannose-6-phosphate isomerase-like protein (cupin superfamily)